jgi:AcrR family transcriptional regulator
MRLVPAGGGGVPRAAFQRLPPERREQILETAAREFAQHGYDGASLNHILAAASVSKGAAYYYFEDKADLFATVARHYLEHVVAEAALDASKLDAATFWARVADVYRGVLAHGVEKPFLVGLAKASWRLSAAGREKALGSVFEWGRSLVRALVARGQEVGVVRSDVEDDLLVDILLGVDGAFDAWLLRNIGRLPQADIERTGSRVLEMVRRLLAPPGGTP